MAINRVRVAWSDTGVVGPGLSTFYFASPGTIGISNLLTLFTTIAANDLPDDVTITVPGSGDRIDELTGTIIGGWTQSGGGSVTGGSSGSFAMGVGGRLRWDTAGVVAGRHVRGTTFLVPMAGASYASDGRIGTTALTRINNALTTFLAAVSPNLVIWSRPAPGRLGSIHPVTLASCPAEISTVRSRRT